MSAGTHTEQYLAGLATVLGEEEQTEQGSEEKNKSPGNAAEKKTDAGDEKSEEELDDEDEGLGEGREETTNLKDGEDKEEEPLDPL